MSHRKKVAVQLTAAEFMAKRAKELAESEQEPASSYYARSFRRGRNWVIRLLKAAANENSREAYRELLEGLLIRLGVEPPDGVLLPSPRPRGAPHKASTELIYQVWLQNGKPNWNSLAYEFY